MQGLFWPSSKISQFLRPHSIATAQRKFQPDRRDRAIRASAADIKQTSPRIAFDDFVIAGTSAGAVSVYVTRVR